MGKLIVIDGHDGAGKSTIAKGVAEKLGYKYLHFFDDLHPKYSIEPLSVTENELIQIVQDMIYKLKLSDNNIILDRGLITPTSLLSKQNWEKVRFLFDEIPTILVYADINTTIKRLSSREVDESQEFDNAYWINQNLEIARYFNVDIIDTTTDNSIDENIELAVEYIVKLELPREKYRVNSAEVMEMYSNIDEIDIVFDSPIQTKTYKNTVNKESIDLSEIVESNKKFIVDNFCYFRRLHDFRTSYKNKRSIIFTNSREKALQIIKSLDEKLIKKIDLTILKVEFINGDTLLWCKNNEAHGLRCTHAYIDRFLDKDTLEDIVFPACNLCSRQNITII